MNFNRAIEPEWFDPIPEPLNPSESGSGQGGEGGGILPLVQLLTAINPGKDQPEKTRQTAGDMLRKIRTSACNMIVCNDGRINFVPSHSRFR